MTLNSALDDLLVTTLKALPGRFRKLEYLSALCSGGACSHWGLARLHGDLAASKAVLQAHRLLVSQVLSTPIPELLED